MAADDARDGQPRVTQEDTRCFEDTFVIGPAVPEQRHGRLHRPWIR